ncbi:MAG: tetratricopeptide repeat protein [Candidatus Aminicenantales bacterium]
MDRRFVLLGLIFLAACSGAHKAKLAPLAPEIEQQIAAADSLHHRGCYVPLKEAFGIYSSLYIRPECRDLAAARLVKNSLLLAVREKELGMTGRTYLEAALAVIKENTYLEAFIPYAEIAGLFWVQGKGVMADIDERFPWKPTEEKLKAIDAELKAKAKVDEFSAYMYATMRCFLAEPSEKIEDPEQMAALFPDSLLLKYKKATCPKENEEELNSILSQELRFYEADYHLGMLSLSRGNLVQAESHLLRMHEGIPESAQATILLASIAFALEEVERSLEFHEKTLDLMPDYRDALLGKAICLSSMGRSQEAISVCEKIIALGYWLLGESYYWIAWNQHELKDYAAAEGSIEQSKGRLPTSAEVFTLAGLIAMDREELARAEKEFQEALKYAPANSDVLYNLGSIYARKHDWPNTGLYFERAGFAFESEGETLRGKIQEAEKSILAPRRKESLINKRRARLERALLSRATSFYNAAAGYFNAGQKYKALEMAARAVEHPALREKAEELMAEIK